MRMSFARMRHISLLENLSHQHSASNLPDQRLTAPNTVPRPGGKREDVLAVRFSPFIFA